MHETDLPRELIAPVFSSVKEKIELFDEQLKYVSKLGETLSEAIKENSDCIKSLSRVEEDYLEDLQEKILAVKQRSKEIQVKLADNSGHCDITATMKELDGQIDHLKGEIQRSKMMRRQIEHKTQKLQRYFDKLKKKTAVLKSNTKLTWYKSLCPVVWHQWKETIGEPGIGVVGEFKWPGMVDDHFALVVACSSECSSKKVVENIDWVWEQIKDAQFCWTVS